MSEGEGLVAVYSSKENHYNYSECVIVTVMANVGGLLTTKVVKGFLMEHIDLLYIQGRGCKNFVNRIGYDMMIFLVGKEKSLLNFKLKKKRKDFSLNSWS